MPNEEKPKAKIFRRPVDDSATRKVSVPEQLIRSSERPDGAKASTVPDSPTKRESSQGGGEFGVDEIPDGGLFDQLFGDEEFDD